MLFCHITSCPIHKQFWLQDTKSSNGTFINNERLSPANQDSVPKEIKSGDVIQFGVDVVENSRRVTHGCIIANIKLIPPGESFNPDDLLDGCLFSSDGRNSSDSFWSSNDKQHLDSDTFNNNINGHHHPTHHSNSSHVSTSGSHLVQSSSSINNNNNFNKITYHQLQQLTSALKEALSREESLSHKLKLLEDSLIQTSKSTENSWRSMAQEEMLLSKIEWLQTKLQSVLNVFHAKTSDEMLLKLKDELITTHDEKEKCGNQMKEKFLKLNQDLLSSESKINELMIEIDSSKEEIIRLVNMNSSLEIQITNLSEGQDQLLKDFDELNQKLSENQENLDKVQIERDNMSQLQMKFSEREVEMAKEILILKSTVDELQDENSSLILSKINKDQEDEDQLKTMVSVQGDLESKPDGQKDDDDDEPTVSQLTRDIQDLNQKLKESGEKYANLMQELKQERESSDMHLKDLTEREIDLERQILNLKSTIDDLTDENRVLSTKLQTQQHQLLTQYGPQTSADVMDALLESEPTQVQTPTDREEDILKKHEDVVKVLKDEHFKQHQEMLSKLRETEEKWSNLLKELQSEKDDKVLREARFTETEINLTNQILQLKTQFSRVVDENKSLIKLKVIREGNNLCETSTQFSENDSTTDGLSDEKMRPSIENNWTVPILIVILSLIICHALLQSFSSLLGFHSTT